MEFNRISHNDDHIKPRKKNRAVGASAMVSITGPGFAIRLGPADYTAVCSQTCPIYPDSLCWHGAGMAWNQYASSGLLLFRLTNTVESHNLSIHHRDLLWRGPRKINEAQRWFQGWRSLEPWTSLQIPTVVWISHKIIWNWVNTFRYLFFLGIL